MLQEEYYVIARENNDNYPLFSWDQVETEYGLGKPVKLKEPVKFRLSNPAASFEWADYHSLPSPVISKLILDALLPLNLYGVQYVPAKVRNPDNRSEKPGDYWYMHVWNQIECLDRKNSELELYSDGMIFGIDKFVMDEGPWRNRRPFTKKG